MLKIRKIRKISSKVGFQTFLIVFFLLFSYLLIIVFFYPEITKNIKKDVPVSLSEVATLVNSDTVKNIIIEGRDIKIELTDGSIKKARKEDESSLSETLKNYGVESSQLIKTPITIKNESGLGFWLLTILPFLIPILIIGFLIWSLTRQVKGAGMQAFSFGQSKAKMTNPSDTKHKITFKDIAGAKEAKQELEEIVDFLKNPQKVSRHRRTYSQRCAPHWCTRNRENNARSCCCWRSKCSIFLSLWF
jgi:cell division protease FtsH